MKPNPPSTTWMTAARYCALLWSISVLTGCSHLTHGETSALGIFQLQPDTLEYPGPPHFWNKAGLVISPTRIVAQVGTEVPMFAGISDDKGQLMPYETVEWSLDRGGVGSFMSVADAHRTLVLDLVSAKPRKIDSSYAVSETLPDNVILTRGTPNITDDMVMPHGYTWVTLTSPHEGVSYVTAFAPDVYSWDARQRSSTIHWIDAEWMFPEPVCATPGSHATLCTCVVRHTTKLPAADWIVKYTITGGAPAGIGADNGRSVEIATDAEGRACAEIIPVDATTGTTCINIELIHAECSTAGEGERLPIASAATQVTWGTSAPDSAVPTTPAPMPIPSSPAPSLPPAMPTPAPAAPAPIVQPQPQPQPTPRPSLPPAAPPATTQPPAQPPAQPPPAPIIDLKVTGPETAQLASDIRFDVEITNRGTAPVSGLTIIDTFPRGLRHGRDGNDPSPIQRGLDALGPIAPGETKKVDIQFRVAEPGQQCHTVEVRGATGVLGSKQACVNVTGESSRASGPQPAMFVDINAPQRTYQVDDQPVFTVEVTNKDTTIPSRGVTVDVTFEQGLRPIKATQGYGRITDGVRFTIDSIAPQSQRLFQVQCQCTAAAPRACGQVAISDASGLAQSQQFCIQIMPKAGPIAGQSNLSVSVRPTRNPVKVNNEVTYVVTITNGSTNPEGQVRLSVTFPDSLALSANPEGPSAISSSDAPTIKFNPILQLRAGESQNYILHFRALRAGVAQVTADLTSQNQIQPLTKAEAVNIIQ